MIDSKALLTGVTPGDWEVDSGGISSKGNFADVAYVSEGHVYSEYTSDSATLEIPNPADARLIASAPRLARRVIELEEALEEMLDTFDGQPMDRDAQADREDAIISRVAVLLGEGAALTIQGEAK